MYIKNAAYKSISANNSMYSQHSSCVTIVWWRHLWRPNQASTEFRLHRFGLV